MADLQSNRTCIICKFVCLSNRTLKRHVNIVHATEENKCSSCGKSFSQVGDLKSHINRRNCEQFSKKIFENRCEICEKHFSNNHYKDKHISLVHGEVKNFECNVFSQKFGGSRQLTLHTKNHHQGDCYSCKRCGNLFATYESLNIHIKKIHERPMNYKCESCGKSYAQSGYLKIHIKTVHEGQKNYKCNSCG